MIKNEFDKEMEKRAKQYWEEALDVWGKFKSTNQTVPADEISFLFQWQFKQIAALQMIVEKLIEHTKMPKLDE